MLKNKKGALGAIVLLILGLIGSGMFLVGCAAVKKTNNIFTSLPTAFWIFLIIALFIILLRGKS